MRMFIYSFVDIMDLLNLIQYISTDERVYLKNFSEYLNQPRGLKIILDQLLPMNSEDAIYAIKLCTHLELSI